jgi:prolyl-tRNA editing enzyme YbaK/EbsC (Cys-tRNA(Pro) deacylase)
MTPAMAFLKAKGIAFSEHEYEYVEHGGTEVPARALQVDINAGRRGVLVKLRSADLASALTVTLVDVARQD